MWDKVGASLLGMEGDRHQRVRGVVAKAFTPRAVKRLHATIIDVIDEIVESSKSSNRSVGGVTATS
ncbi:MAG: hypothetical protein ACXWD3_06645, partial [Mycobacterium sp.]